MGDRTTRTLRSANDEFQLLEALLTNRRKRKHQGAFLVHGVRSIEAALANGWPLRTVLLSEDASSRWALQVRQRTEAEVVRVAAPLLERLSQREDSAEVVAVAERQEREVQSVPSRDARPIVVAEAIKSPGNLGTILRSSAALGAAAVVVTGHAADPYDPQAVRASAGALFSIPFALAPSVKDVMVEIERRTVGLHPDGEVIDGVDL